MKIETFQGGYDKNFSYIVWCEKTKFAAIIDPAVASNQIIEKIKNLNLTLTKIMITKRCKHLKGSFQTFIKHERDEVRSDKYIFL